MVFVVLGCLFFCFNIYKQCLTSRYIFTQIRVTFALINLSNGYKKNINFNLVNCTFYMVMKYNVISQCLNI